MKLQHGQREYFVKARLISPGGPREVCPCEERRLAYLGDGITGLRQVEAYASPIGL